MKWISKIVCIFFFSFFLIWHVKAIEFDVDSTTSKTNLTDVDIPINVDGEGKQVRLSQMSTYSSNDHDAFCLDPNLSSGVNAGVYGPGLEQDHEMNLYQFYISGAGKNEIHNDKSLTINMIRVGQNYLDGSGNERHYGENYQYKDMSTVLRMIWFKTGWYVPFSTEHYEGAYKELYDAFEQKDYGDLMDEDEDEDGKCDKSCAKELYETKPYGEEGDKSEKADGFVYGSGFWEVRYKAVEESEHPGYVKQDDGTWTYDAMYKTNIRIDGYSGVTCDDITYNSNPDLFECEIIPKADDLIFDRTVAWIHLKSKDGVSLDGKGFQIRVSYHDRREANNFWVTYLIGSEDSYDRDVGNANHAKQRMYVINEVDGSFTIPVGDQPLDPPGDDPDSIDNTRNCTPNYDAQVCKINDDDSSPYEFTIGDDKDCVLSRTIAYYGDENTHSGVYNTNIYDTADKDNLTQYTQKTNEYCNISCAEEITFRLPKKKFAYSGQYFTIDSIGDTGVKEVTLKGTKTCRAYIGTKKFQNEINKTTDQSDDNRISNLYRWSDNRYTFYGLEKSDNYFGYGLLNQLTDLSTIYNDLKNAASQFSSDYGWRVYKNELLPNRTSYSYTWNWCTEYSDTCGYSDEYGWQMSYLCYSKDVNTTLGTITGFKNVSGRTCPLNNTLWINSEKIYGTQNDNKTITSSSSSSLDILNDMKSQVDKAYTDVHNKITSAISDINSCGTAFNSVDNGKGYKAYDLTPKIKFSYDEKYSEWLTGFTEVSSTTNYTEAKFNKTGDISYTKLEGGSDTFSGYYYSNEDYIDYEAVVEKGYISNTDFYRMPGTGVIMDSKNNDLAQSIGKVFPVALNRKKNLNPGYKYKFNFTNLGYDIGGTGTGRLDRYGNNGNGGGAQYTCYYEVDNDIVRIPDKDIDKENAEDLFKQNYFYRSISLNNFDPQNRIGNDSMGKNWINEKATETIKRITDASEEIYSEEPEYHFKLTAQNMQNIRKYNQDQESGNGYQDFNMKLYTSTIKDKDDEWYTSNFIDMLATHTEYAQEVSTNGRNSWMRWTDTSSTIGPAWK